MTEDEVDESFEIISLKEKVWKDLLKTSELDLAKSEAMAVINKVIVEIAEKEIGKEAEKNKKSVHSTIPKIM